MIVTAAMMAVLHTQLMQAEVDGTSIRTLHAQLVVIDAAHAQAVVAYMLRLVGPVRATHSLSAKGSAQLLVVHLQLMLRARRVPIVGGSMSADNIDTQVESIVCMIIIVHARLSVRLVRANTALMNPFVGFFRCLRVVCAMLTGAHIQVVHTMMEASNGPMRRQNVCLAIVDF